MKRIFLIVAIVFALLPDAYSQTKRPNTQQRPTPQPTETTNSLPENSVTGSLTFNGKTVDLPYVYAKLGEVDYKPGIHLLFTDRPIVQSVAQDRFQAKVKSGDVNGIYVQLDAKTKRAVGYWIGINKELLLVYNYDYSRAQGQGFSGEVFNLTMPNPSLLQGTISANRTTDRLDFAKSEIGAPRFLKYVYQFNLTLKAQIKADAWTGNFGVYPPINLELGRAEGEMIDKGQKKKLNYVTARMKSTGFKDEFGLSLIFTEQPISQGSPGKEHTPYLQIRINPKSMAVVGVDIMRANGNDSFGSSAMPSDFTIRNGNSVEGRFSLAGTYNVACKALIEADREAPVTAGAGKPLPVGGDEPGRAFVQYMTALEGARTLEDAARVIKNFMASFTQEVRTMDETKLQSMSAKEKKDAFDLVRVFYVIGDLKVTGGLIDGDRATLNVGGVQDKDEVKGEVNMHLEGGRWKVGKSSVSPTGKFVRPKPGVKPPGSTASKTTDGITL